MEVEVNKRKDDDSKAYFRSGRFYSVADEWYFCVREKQDQGPFPTKATAEEYLKTYLTDFEHFSSNKTKLDVNKIKIN